MSRPCAWCNSPQRVDWEKSVASGVPVSAVSIDTGYSESAARRHLRLHVRPQLLAEMRDPGARLHVADFASGLVELLEEADRVLSYSVATNAPKLSLAAIDSKRATYLALMARLGVDRFETAEVIEESRAFVGAVVTVLQAGTFTALGEAFAVEMELAGLHDLARKMREMNTTRAEEVTQ